MRSQWFICFYAEDYIVLCILYTPPPPAPHSFKTEAGTLSLKGGWPEDTVLNFHNNWCALQFCRQDVKITVLLRTHFPVTVLLWESTSREFLLHVAYLLRGHKICKGITNSIVDPEWFSPDTGPTIQVVTDPDPLNQDSQIMANIP
jgi:hypothetical protein